MHDRTVTRTPSPGPTPPAHAPSPGATAPFDQPRFAAPRTLRTAIVERVREELGNRTRFGIWFLVTELFIGLGWARAAAAKIIDPAWWSGATIGEFADDHAGLSLSWYDLFLDNLVVPLAPLVALVVVGLQVVAATALLTGRRQVLGLGVGVFLNLHFLAAGAVNPSAFYLLSQGALALALLERRRRLPLRAIGMVEFGAIALAVMSLPSIATIHPAHVIDDPAVMVTTAAMLTVFALETLLHLRSPHRVGAR